MINVKINSWVGKASKPPVPPSTLNWMKPHAHVLIMCLIFSTLKDPNMEDNHGRNALHLACNNFSNIDITEVVTLLIER